MIRHTILFKVKQDVSEETINQVINGLCLLTKNLPDVFSAIGGECHFHDEKSIDFFTHDIAHGASHCISIDFTDNNALDSFFENPATYPAKMAIVNITEKGYNGIVAFDLENPAI